VADERSTRGYGSIGRVLWSLPRSSRIGVPVTSTARTVADLRRATAEGRPGALSPRALRKAIRQADVLGLPTDEMSRGDRTRSDLEGDFIFLWREQRLVVETDHYVYHRGQIAFQDDRDRDLELRRLGYEVLRLSEKQVDEEGDGVAEVLARTLAKEPRR